MPGTHRSREETAPSVTKAHSLLPICCTLSKKKKKDPKSRQTGTAPVREEEEGRPVTVSIPFSLVHVWVWLSHDTPQKMTVI